MPDLVSVNTLLADDLRTRAVEVLRFAPTAASDALKLLIGLERDLVTKLAAVGLSADEPTVYQRARLDALLRQVRATIASTYSTIDRTTTDLLVELADAQTNWAAGSLNQNLGVSIAASNFSPQQLRAIVSSALIEGAPSKSWWSRQAGDVLHRFEAAMRTGLVSGETNAQLIQRVRGTRKNRFSDGIMAVPRRNAEALVRTSVMAVSNQAHLETWQANADVVGALMHVSTLDSRTTLVCIARSGMRWKVTGEPLGDALPFNPPPIHWNCRSVLVPVTKTFRELGLDVDEVPAGTRASIDGQVPADLSFNDWLRGKSEAFQDELLGPGRAALWRKGQISLTDLVDQRDRPLTIEQLKELGGKPKEAPKPGKKTYSAADLAPHFRDPTEADAAFWSAHVKIDPARFKEQWFGGADSGVSGTIKLRTKEYENGKTYMFVSSTFTIGDSEETGDLVREIVLDRKTGAIGVEHSLFTMPLRSSSGTRGGTGLGKEIISRHVAIWQEMGVKSVAVHANIDVGGYAWARYGFTPEPLSWDRLRSSIANRLDLYSKSIADADKAALRAIVGRKDPKAIWAVADSRLLVNGEPAGKALLIDSDWRGQLDLTDADSLARFTAYVGKAKQ